MADIAAGNSCEHRETAYYVYQGRHATDFEYPAPGDYIQFHSDGTRTVWAGDVFEETFEKHKGEVK